MKNDRQQKERVLALKREKRIRRARESFWQFCTTLAPDFYKESRVHLKHLCKTLQALYEGKLLKPDNTPYKRLMINMPPRHGKSRTLILFCEWCLGVSAENRIITCSYNDDLATDFSRYTRDGIMDDKTYPHEIVYTDIFPDSKVKQGNASYHQWALDGQFFSYKGAGVGGSITGKGCNCSIVDDPVKDAETALNELALEKIWRWYTGTFLSRLEEGGIQIVNMTRWASKDICGRILDGEEADEWYVLKLEAYQDGKMLCNELLSYRSYKSLESNMVPEIFRANYHQEPVDIKGLLYPPKELQYFKPAEIEGKKPAAIVGYTDVADEGTDFLANPIGKLFTEKIYITDIVFSQQPAEVTEGLVAQNILDTECELCVFESNNGGKGYARNVKKLVDEGGYSSIKWIPNMQNKETRIIMKAGFIKKHFVFLEKGEYQPGSHYDMFMKQLTSYTAMGKNEHDDAPDACTGLAALVEQILKKKKQQGKKRHKSLYGGE